MSLFVALTALALTSAFPTRAQASCNVIPGTQLAFVGELGAVNRPFAAPGDELELRLGPCQNSTFTGALDTRVVFKPPTYPGAAAVGPATAVSVPSATVSVSPNGDSLSFLLPDSAAVATYGLAGPAMLVVSHASTLLDADAEDMTCEELLQACATQPGSRFCDVVACVDTLLLPSGSCAPGEPHPIFSSFTGLPEPNDYKAICTEPLCEPGHEQDSDCCSGTVEDTLFTVDAVGNVLIPVNWKRILVRRQPTSPALPPEPVPRLLSASSAVPAFKDGDPAHPGNPTHPALLPGPAFTASYSPEGARLDPIFEPQPDAANQAQTVIFGSADAEYTVLRFARRSAAFRACSGGTRSGDACVEDDDCPGIADGCDQQAQCVGGSNPGTPCMSDNACTGGGECGNALFEFRDRLFEETGPIVVSQADGVQPGMGGPSPAYELDVENPTPLGGLFQSDLLSAFVIDEQLDGGNDVCPPCPHDLNGDNDTGDQVVVLENRLTGARLPLTGSADGVAVRIASASTRSGPIARFPAVAVENDVLACIDSDSNLRVWKLDGTGTVANELTASSRPAVHEHTFLDQRSLVISDGLVFVRRQNGANVELARYSTEPPVGLTALGTVNGLHCENPLHATDCATNADCGQTPPPQNLQIQCLPTVPEKASIAGGAAVFMNPGGALQLARKGEATEAQSVSAALAVIGGSCAGGGPPCRNNDDCDGAICEPSFVAAAWTEASEGDLNEDSDPDDDVLHVRRAAAGQPWVKPVGGAPPRGQATAEIGIAGALVGFTLDEEGQGEDLNADGDACDNDLLLFDAQAGALKRPDNSAGDLFAVFDFVVGDGAVAFRTSEIDYCAELPQGAQPCGGGVQCPPIGAQCDFNVDNDCNDLVLFAYEPEDPLNPGNDNLIASRQEASGCFFPGCDPRRPYRIVTNRMCRGGGAAAASCTVNADCGNTPGASCVSLPDIKFLTDECRQGCAMVGTIYRCLGGSNDGASCADVGDCPGGVCERQADCVEDRSLYDSGEFTGQCNLGSNFLGLDLNGNGDAQDFIVRSLNVETGKVIALSTVDRDLSETSDPYDAANSGGRCVLGTLASPDACGAGCPDGSFCDEIADECVLRSPGGCETSARTLCPNGAPCFDATQCSGGVGPCAGRPGESAQCPQGSFCDTGRAVAVANGNNDADTVPDGVDNCPFVANADQADIDLDGVGDVCDSETCPNGIREAAEQCDDGNLTDGDGCARDCTVEGGHFRLYKAKRTTGTGRFDARDVTLADRFVTKSLTAVRPVHVGVPLDLNGAGVDDPTTYMTCYTLRGPNRRAGLPQQLSVQSEIGTSGVNVIAPQSLCLPSGKNGVPPGLTPDHFQCYKVRETTAPTRVDLTLADEIKSGPATAVRLASLCAPVDDGGGIHQPAVLLACYKTEGAATQTMAGSSQDVTMSNDFGAGQPTTIYSKKLLDSLFASSPAREQICIPATVVP